MKLHFAFIFRQHLALLILIYSVFYLNSCIDEYDQLNQVTNIQPNHREKIITVINYYAACKSCKSGDAEIKGHRCALLYFNKTFKAVKNALHPKCCREVFQAKHPLRNLKCEVWNCEAHHSRKVGCLVSRLACLVPPIYLKNNQPYKPRYCLYKK